MEDIEIINLWKSKDKTIEDEFRLNRKNADELLKIKAQSLISSMKPIKILAIVIAAFWVGIAGALVIKLFLFNYNDVSLFFLYSAALQVILTAVALIVYLYQTITIYQISVDEPILETQEKIAKLKSTTLFVVRLLILQLPLWTTFYWRSAMPESGHLFLWLLQGVITISFTTLALWLFVNIKYENKDKKWFKYIFNTKEWMPLMKSMDLLNQIKEYK